MKRLPSAVLLHGALAGLLAGAIVALWFLFLDLVRDSAFHTPLLLARTVLVEETGATTAQLVAGYTILHFGVFAGLGVVAAWGLQSLRIAPSFFAGVLVGVIVLETVHYGALLLTGADVLAVLPPGNVLAANLLGGVGMMAYLHRATAAATPFGLAALRGHETLARGVATGLIGAAAVAVWFFLLDAWQGQPFFTPAALGSALFLGAERPAEVQVGLGLVVAYTVVHVAAFVAVGSALVWIAERLERAPAFWLVALMAFIILEGAFLAFAAGMAGWVLGALGVWAVAAGNLLAVAAMGTWIWATHPLLRRQFVEMPLKTHF